MHNAVNTPRPWVSTVQPFPNAPEQVADIQPVMPLSSMAGVLLVFMRFSMLAEIQAASMGVNLYLLYIAAIPASLAIVVSGGLKRAFRGGPAYFWMGYMMWIALATPFSSWRGDSARLLGDFLRTNIPMLFVIAGLAVSWRICKYMMYAIALGAVVNLIASRVFMRDFGGRAGLVLGTVGNPNDFAGHLLLALPFLLWLALSSKFIPLRVGALAGVGYGTYLIVRTASRGALIALAIDVLFLLWRGSVKQRIALLLVGPIAAGALLMIMPNTILGRLSSFSAGDSNREAVESSESRIYLLSKSVEYTLKFPLFGVGPGQFPNYEGMNNRVIGTHGSFHGTHNTYTQIAAECGIPALLLYLAGIVSTLRLLNSTFKEARKRPDCQDIRTAALCIMVGTVGFCAAIFFLNFAYSFYLPTIGGLAVAVYHAAKREFSIRQPQAA